MSLYKKVTINRKNLQYWDQFNSMGWAIPKGVSKMTKIGLFYGSSTDNTSMVADMIKEKFDAIAPNLIEIFDIGDVEIFDLMRYERLIVGSSTWNIGDLQDDWDIAYEDMDDLDFTDAKVAMFGVGDQYSYADNYCDAIGILGLKFRELGAELVGFTDIDDSYDFEESKGVENGHWLGMAVDEDNQDELTEERVAKWVAQLIQEFKVKEIPV